MSRKQQTDRTRNNTVLRSWRRSTHQVNPSVETANDELLISGGRRGKV